MVVAMASQKLVFLFILLSIFTPQFQASSFSYEDSATTSTKVVGDSSLSSNVTIGDDKVTLSLYYESLCPYCASFIVNQLGAMFQTDLISIVNLRLIPWGNTERNNQGWICQHGPDECVLNLVESCAIKIWPDVGLHFKFIKCVEGLHLEGKSSQWESCFGKLELNPEPINDCYKTAVGTNLELAYASETNLLKPPHRFVPWVLVNNIPLQEDYQKFMAYICKAYKGQNKPEACRPQLTEIKQSAREESTNGVCYARKPKNLQFAPPPEKTGPAKASSGHQKEEAPA